MAEIELVDLTLGLEAGMTTFPSHWHPVFEVCQLGRLDLEGRETRKIIIGTHTGTHIDAPRHFVAGGNTIDRTPLSHLVGPARLLDLTDIHHGSQVEAGEIMSRLHKRVPERLVLRFDWSDHWGQAEYYSDYPYLSADACAALIQGGLRLLALDTPSPDDPRNGPGGPVDSPNHKMLLEAGVTVVEYLTNLRALTGPWTTLIALPLKVVGADGSPARVVAVDGIISGVVQPETT